MAAKNWSASYGLFSSGANWTPDGAPAAGDNFYVPNGVPILFNQTFGSASVPSSIGLTSTDASQPSRLVAWNTTLTNVRIDNNPPPVLNPGGPPPAGYTTARHGVLVVGGTTTNDGGTIMAGRGLLYTGQPLSGNSLDIVVAPQSTLINKGTIFAGPTSSDTMTVSGYGGSTLQNDGRIVANSGKVTISTDLTGTGNVEVSTRSSNSAGGFVELGAAVDAGQTINITFGTLQIDQPARFLGQVDLGLDRSSGGGEVRLEGLQAQSWDLSGNTMEFFDASGAVINTLRLATPPDPASLKVYETSNATYGSAVSVSYGLFGPGQSDSTPVLLPYHMAAAA